MSPLGTATGPAGLLSPLGTATGPAAASSSAGGMLPLPATGNFSTVVTGSAAIPGSPVGGMAIPITGQLQPGQTFGATRSMVMPATGPLERSPSQAVHHSVATFGAVSTGLMVPPTAPTFASMPVIAQAPPPAIATKSLPAVPPPPSFISQYAIGSQVEYYSHKMGTWIKATVQGFSEQANEYVLDVDAQAPPHKLRPLSVLIPVPTPPASGVVTIAAAPQTMVAAAATPVAPPSAWPMQTFVAGGASGPFTNTLPPTNMTVTSIAENPFASAVMVTGPTQSISPTSAAAVAPMFSITAPVMEPVAAPMPPTSTMVVRQIGTSVGHSAVAAASRPAEVFASASMAARPMGLVEQEPIMQLDAARVSVVGASPAAVASPPIEPVIFPVQTASSQVDYVPMQTSYTAQGDAYIVPSEDIWLPVGQPAVRVEPNWRDGQWFYTTAVDFKGLERCPLGSKQDMLILADEALLSMEENGEIPPLPMPRAWTETDTCPIT